ncbi:MAG: bifunctional diaminohydroxyphosphoribosylaminopyrimidine deaminase/5-amino-6-(5-phosphoribosylamino)uracil reductase RibD [Pseudomonadota bacterium]
MTAHDSEADLMERAQSLAELASWRTRPNPSVGCVLVKDGLIVGEGATEPAGLRHAERVALDAAQDQARGSRAYVTLEPCAHSGRTGACTDALIAAEVAEVVYAEGDPNPAVNGRGISALVNAGIAVRQGPGGARTRELNAGFFSRILHGRPRVVLKSAASLDGASAMRSGESQWITGPAARSEVQRLRALSGAIVTGAGTVLADDPALTVRDARFADLPDQPLRVVLDSKGRSISERQLYNDGNATRVYVGPGVLPHNFDAPVSQREVAADAAGRVQLSAVLDDLAELEINDVLIEAGAGLSGAFAASGLVDEYRLFMAPVLLGSETGRMFDTPELLQLKQGLNLELVQIDTCGPDLYLTLHPRNDHRENP